MGSPQGHVQNALRSISTSTIVVSSDPLSLTLLTSSAMKTFENVEEDSDEPEPPGE
jgi:hypothetical protein